MRRDEAKSAVLVKIEYAEFGVADANGFLKHGRKHRLKIARRAADDLEHLRRGRLLLQGLGEVSWCAGAVR